MTRRYRSKQSEFTEAVTRFITEVDARHSKTIDHDTLDEVPLRNYPSVTLRDRVRQMIKLAGDPDISPEQFRAAAVAMLHFADTPTGKCYPSRPQLAEKSCVSENTTKAMWDKLEKKGVVDVERSKGGRNKRNVYHFRNPSTVEVFEDQNPSVDDTKPLNERVLNPSAVEGAYIIPIQAYPKPPNRRGEEERDLLDRPSRRGCTRPFRNHRCR
jgi:DNA-binding MarR family transcriptional regulator